jgi:formate hydrogenlyase subunit 4
VLVPLALFDPWVAAGLLLAGLAAVAVLVGIIEAAMARLRMDRIPQFLVAASALAGFGVILLLR